MVHCLKVLTVLILAAAISTERKLSRIRFLRMRVSIQPCQGIHTDDCTLWSSDRKNKWVDPCSHSICNDGRCKEQKEAYVTVAEKQCETRHRLHTDWHILRCLKSAWDLLTHIKGSAVQNATEWMAPPKGKTWPIFWSGYPSWLREFLFDDLIKDGGYLLHHVHDRAATPIAKVLNDPNVDVFSACSQSSISNFWDGTSDLLTESARHDSSKIYMLNNHGLTPLFKKVMFAAEVEAIGRHSHQIRKMYIGNTNPSIACAGINITGSATGKRTYGLVDWIFMRLLDGAETEDRLRHMDVHCNDCFHCTDLLSEESEQGQRKNSSKCLAECVNHGPLIKSSNVYNTAKKLDATVRKISNWRKRRFWTKESKRCAKVSVYEQELRDAIEAGKAADLSSKRLRAAETALEKGIESCAVKVLMTGLDDDVKETLFRKLLFDTTVYRDDLGAEVFRVSQTPQDATRMLSRGHKVKTIRYKGRPFVMWDVKSVSVARHRERLLEGTHALVYVVDCSADEEKPPHQRIRQATAELHRLMSYKAMHHTCLLVYANSCSDDGARGRIVERLTQALHLELSVNSWHVQPLCTKSGEGLQEGLAWLSANINFTSSKLRP